MKVRTKKDSKPLASSKPSCCDKNPITHPSHIKQMHRVSRIRGQLDGVTRMIEERRYCPEIIMQIQAIRSALSSLESKLLETHLNNCVKDAFRSSDEKAKDKKIEEILQLVKRS